jgi:uncharacterized protein (DUF697 family)
MSEDPTPPSDRPTEDFADLEDWMRVVDRLPFIGNLKRDLTTLRKLLYDRRAPRIAVLRGPEDDGTEEIANALLAATALGSLAGVAAATPGEWMFVDAHGRRLDWLELVVVDPWELAAEPALEIQQPDLIVVVRHVEHVDGLAPFVRAARRLQKELTRTVQGKTRKPELLVLLTGVNALAEDGGVADSPEAQAKLRDVLGAAKKVMAAERLDEDAVVGLDARAPRYGVVAAANAIVGRLPEAAKMEAARGLEIGPETRRNVARDLVNAASSVAITVGLAPVPFADAFVLLPLQTAMVTGVAYLSGRAADWKVAGEYLGTLGVAGASGMGLRMGARQLIKLVPGAGSLIGASVAGAGTLAIGRGAIAYFIDGPGAMKERPQLTAEATPTAEPEPEDAELVEEGEGEDAAAAPEESATNPEAEEDAAAGEADADDPPGRPES